MKLFLMTDLEGVAGVINADDWIFADSRYYKTAKQLLTMEVNAAIEGFYAGGFDEIVVVDGHGQGAINPVILDGRATYLRDWKEEFGPGTYWPFGLDESYSAVAFVGQHAKAGTEFSHITHTGSFNCLDLSVNGLSIGEYGQIALVKAPGASLFTIPSTHTAKVIKKDLVAARADWIEAAKDDSAEHRHRTESDFLKVKTSEGKLDFHALRHTFGSLLASSGVHPKIAQELMRHSDINLTMSLYTHAQTSEVKAAIDQLPNFQRQVSVRTGTDNMAIDAIGISDVKSSATYSDSLHSKHSKTLQNRGEM